ncbi:MAG: adenylate/guanylate cyclase domain-containing protein, partial [Leptospiraceae bacterium]|nr:adenylate/guanylate cyclase domain-containing protein [Leptospiraceae bacterium]
MLANLKKIHWAILIGILPFLLVVLLKFSGTIERLEDITLDSRYRQANPNNSFTDKLVILDIDENSLSAYANTPLFGKWPWSRRVYPPILQYIASGGAQMILFDIMFFEEGKDALDEENAEDKELIMTTAGLGNISHAIVIKNEKELTPADEEAYHKFIPENILAQGIQVENLEALNLGKNNSLSFPAARFVSAAKETYLLGAITPYTHVVTYSADIDGVARKAFPLFRYRDLVYPSLTLRAYNQAYPVKSYKGETKRLTLEREDGRIVKVPLNEKGKYRLHYYSQEVVDSLPRIGISGVIDTIRALETGEIQSDEEGKVPLSKFKDKIVIVGTSAASTYDTRLTPYGDRPGFTYHAIFFSNLAEEHFLNPPSVATWILILGITIPVCVYFSLFFQHIALRVIFPILIFLTYPLVAFLAFKVNIHLPLAEFLTSYPIAFLSSMAYLTLTEGAERRKYNKVLSNMVDPTIVSEALNDLETLKKGGEKEITAFFSDVASFSTISEQLSSTDLAALLNEYLGAMTIILKENKGTLDKYIGDAIVGIFGAPIDRPNHFHEAAKASLEMMERLDELRKIWTAENKYIPDAQNMNVRIGLNSGKAKVGFMGTESLASYTMMGDTVNLAARLEAAGKDYGVSILISEATKLKIEDEFFTRELDAVRVKGKNEPVKIYELISVLGKTPPNLKEAAELYEVAFKMYLNRDWKKAISKFQESEKAKG